MNYLHHLFFITTVAIACNLSAQSITYSSPIDLTNHSNVSFDQPFDVSSELEEPEGIAFSSDGTKMFVLGSFNFPEIDQYSLTTPFDISSGVSFDGSPLDISSQVSTPYSLTFNPDGTKMYIVGSGEVNQYSLSTPFNITSGVTFDNNPFDLTTQEGQPTGLTFNSDGTKMFVTGFNNDNVYQYSLSSPYNTTTGVSHDGNPLDISSEVDYAVGIAFNTNGSKLFIVNSLNRQVLQYSLSTPYIVTSGVTHDGNSPFISSEDLTPRGIVFNTTGTKMFVTGRSDHEINQYSLSVNVFKESSSNDASVNGSLTISISEDTFVNGGGLLTSPTHFNVDNLPNGLTPSMSVMTDGLSASMTLAGNATELSDIPDLQFTFTDAAFTTSNASSVTNATGTGSGLGIDFNSRKLSYFSPINLDAGVSFDGSPLDLLPQDLGPGDITFSADGTIMYMVGTAGTDINRYNLTTPFDITSGVSFYNSRNLSGEMDTSMGMVFNNDGTKMFVVGRGFFSSAVHQYTLVAAPYGILNAAYNGSFNVTNEDFQMSGIAFNTDGSKMFLIGDINDQVHQYTLTTPFEVTSGVSYDGSPLSVASEETTPTDVAFNADGSHMFVTGSIFDEISQYELSTPFDITSGVSLSSQFDVSSEEGAPTGVAFNTDGTKMYVMGAGDDEVNQYTLSSNVFIENNTNDGTVVGSLIIQLTNDAFINAGSSLTSGIDYSISNLPSGLIPDLSISSDGLSAKLTLSGNADNHGIQDGINDLLFTFENSAFSVSDANAVTNAVDANSSFGIDFDVNPVLTYHSPIQLANPVIWEDSPLNVSLEEGLPQGLTFSADGLKMFIVGAIDSDVDQYSLTTPYNIISGVTHDGSPFDVAAEESAPTGIAFDAEGTKMFILGIGGGSEVNQYSLSSPFDITSGVTFDGSPFSLASEELFAQDLTFNSDGTKMYIVGSNGDEVNQYSLSTPFDITSGVLFDGSPLDISSEESDALGLAFNVNGTRLFISGQGGQEINQYILSTPFDITSGVTVDTPYDLSAVDPTPTGIAFNDDGTTLLVLGFGFGAEVNQFSLSTGIFTESASNDGSVSGELIISITDDTFSLPSLSYPTDFSITNLPAGFSANVNVTSDRLFAAITISGNASNHQEVDNLDDLIFTFENSAFTGNNASAVFNSNNASSGFGIDFSENASLTYRSTIDITDATSISFAGNPFDISAEDTGPQDIAFSKDGYKMFILGVANDIVIQYSLVTPFETTGGVSLDGTTSIPNNAGGLTFNSDGTKMYIMEFNNDEVYQYSLTTPFDITAGISSDGAPFDVTTEESSPFGIAFNANGTKMFIVGSGSNQVNQYTLSSPYETTSGVTFDGTPFDVSAETVAPVDISFNPTGTKMFVVGQIFQEINQYSLLSPFDVTSGGSFDGTYSVSIEDQTPRGVSFNFEGTKMFIVGAGGDQVYQYNLGAVTFNEVSANDGSVQGELLISIADDSFTNPGSTLAYSTDFNIINLPAGLVPNLSVASDGLSAILTISGNATNHQEDDNLDNIIFTFENSAFVGNNALSVLNSANANSGFGIGFANNPILTYASSIDLSNPVTIDGSPLDLSTEESFPQGFTFSPDGLKMFVVGANDTEVNQYSLTNPFDITSGVTFDGSPFDVSSEETVPTGIAFNTAGTRMFISGIAGGSEINQYSLTTPFDVTSGVTFDGSSYSVATEELFVQDLIFNLDGTKLFIVGSDGDEVNQYSLTTPFDITSGVSFDGNPLDISNEETDAFGIAFNAIGNKLFISGQNGQEINQYHLDNPFDITSGVTTDTPYDISSIDPTPTGIAFNNTGTKLLVIGLGFGAEVNQFSLSTNVFTESTANDGSVSGELLISITDDSFTNPGSTLAYPTDFSITNLPTGLTPNLAVANDGLTATLNFTGTADNHLFSDDVDELIFTFENSAFTGNNASAVNDAIAANSNFGIDFISSSETDILSFSFPEQTSVAVIDDVNHTIDIEVAALTNATNLVSTFTLSEGAILQVADVDQVSGITANDYTNPVTYTITADDEVTTQDWTVTVTVVQIPALIYSKSPDLSELSPTGAKLSVATEEDEPKGIAFSADGLKLFVVGNAVNVFEYTLSSPYDLSTATLSNSLDVSSEEVVLQAISFNNEGTKLFLLGASNGVNQYGLSSSFDISTANYISSYSVQAQDVSPFGLSFSSSGSKMYIVGNFNDNVYEYQLSTSFDVSTASFNFSFSTASVQEVPTDLWFSKDGSKMYLTGFTGSAVNEFSLSTPFDLTTATHDISVSVLPDATSPHALTFNQSMSKLYVAGITFDEVVEFDFGQQAFTETSSESGMLDGELNITLINETFTNAGGTLTLPTDFTIANLPIGLGASLSISVDGKSAILQLSGMATSHTDADDIDDLIFTFENSSFTGNDASAVSNAINASSNLGIDFLEDNPPVFTSSDVADFNENGTGSVLDIDANDGDGGIDDDNITYAINGGADQTLFNLDINDGVLTFISSPDYDIPNDANTDNDYELEISADDGINTTIQSVVITVLDVNEDPVFTSTNTADFDENATGAVIDVDANDGDTGTNDLGITYSISGGDDQSEFNIDEDNGMLTFLTAPDFEDPQDANLDNVYEVQVTADDGVNTTDQLLTITIIDLMDIPSLNYAAGFNIQTAFLNDTRSVIDEEDGSRDVEFSSDGLKMYLLGSGNTIIHQYSLSDPFQISTATFMDTFIDAQGSSGFSLTFNNDGSQLFVLGNNEDEVNQYLLTTPWEINTATFSQSISITNDEPDPSGLLFNDDGTSMFVSGTLVSEFTLTSPFDISTAVFLKSFTPVAYAMDVSFSNDGSRMLIVDVVDNVLQYDLGAPYDVTTASPQSESKFIGSDGNAPHGFTFDPDFTSMFIADAAIDAINEYKSATAFFESSSNDGSVTGTLTIRIVNGSFSNADGDLTSPTDYTISNLPADLTPNLSISADAKSAILTLTGNASNHQKLNGVTDLIFSFENSAFEGNDAIDVENALSFNTNLGIFFDDNPNTDPTISDQIFSIDENATFGTSIGTVEASDADSDPLTYSITNGNTNDAFAIDASTGSLIVNSTSALNFETTSSFALIVEVNDGNGGISDATITVNLLDINESPLISDQTFSMDENSPFGAIVGTVVATDPENDPLTFSIITGNTLDAFSINASNGELAVNNSSALDFESREAIDVGVQVDDGNSTIATAVITVQLNDIDESSNTAPVISDQSFTIDENSPFGTTIGTVVASDADSDALSYSITAGNTNDAFAIDISNGDLSVNNSSALDFETTPSFSLTVEVNDGLGGIADATITISLNDVDENENAEPVITDQSFSIDENSPNGASVGTVIATDEDGDALTYSITNGNTNNAFAIGSSTGDLTVKTTLALDFETTPSFALNVEVNDGNGGIANATITINLKEIEEATGIKNLDQLMDIYPNPFTNKLIIELKQISKDYNIILTDISGKTLKSFNGDLPNELIMDLSGLSDGLYILHIETSLSNAVIRVLKKAN
ncbi:cadherin domain-containing protein [Ekhidna sp.]|uniref:cadherin domain-containing protein n=1 Tax=Ekhidna sp. TaxID=2608089 RepID=UPI003B50C9F5